MTELVHVIYDAPEGKSASSDALRAQVIAHLAAIDRFRTALAAVQNSGAGISLSVANQKNERERLQRFLDVIGLKLTEKNKIFSVVPTVNRDAADRLQLLAVLEIDLDGLVTRLNSGESVRIEMPTETIPLPLPAQVWSGAVFQRPIGSESLFSAVIQDRSAALLCYGLAAVDDETLRYLADHPAVLRRLYEQDAAVFAAFAGSLRIRQNAVLVPGGAPAHRAVGSRVRRADCHSRPVHSRVVLARRRARGLSLRLGHAARCEQARVCAGSRDRRSRATAEAVQVFPHCHPGVSGMGGSSTAVQPAARRCDPDAPAH